ncbi:MAG: hypothetical protein J6J45_02520 [Clostridia bacterium]|nr:hypothetical protein [Clostridia bacterium]
MAKCPKCGVKLHIWNIKAECPKCGVNIANYDWENRLEKDAEEAEIAFAKLRETLKRFKYSFIGTKLRIARIPVSVLPLFSFLLPLGMISVSLPFYSEKITVNAISIVMNIINGLDIGGIFKGMSSEFVGDSYRMFGISLILVVLSVLSLLVSLVFLLTNFRNFKSKGLFITNLVASAMMLASSFTFNKFSQLVADGSFAAHWQSSPSWGVYVSAALFLASAIINLCVSLQKVELPADEEKAEPATEEKEEETVNA